MSDEFTEAKKWFLEYIVELERINQTCMLEGLSDDLYFDLIDFVEKCWSKGIKASFVVDLLFQRQQEYNEQWDKDCGES